MDQFSFPRSRMADLNAKARHYRECDVEAEAGLSLNACTFRAARLLRLVEAGETGAGWNRAEICDLTDRVRVTVESDATVLDDLPGDIRALLLSGLNLFPNVS